MARLGVLSGSEWWRASEYDLVGGTHIAPAPGAEIEFYDPFVDHESYWGGQRRKGKTRPPYASLGDVDLRDPKQVLEWCHKYGLLGILQHRTLEAFFWPHWEPVQFPSGSSVSRVGAVSGQLMTQMKPAQPVYRASTGDDLIVHEFQPGSGPFENEDELLSEEELEEALKRGHRDFAPMRYPGVRIAQFVDGALSERSLAEGWAQFFPDQEGVSAWSAHEGRYSWGFTYDGVDAADNLTARQEIQRKLERTRYPFPGEPKFFQQYGEPLHLFRAYARRLRADIKMLEDAREKASVEDARESLDNSFTGRREDLPASVAAALERVRPDAKLTVGNDDPVSWGRRWAVPSLHAALNVMVLQDIVFGGAVARNCETCDTFFPTDDMRQRYCSDRCQKTMHQRRYRKRNDDAESPSQGDSDD